VGCVIFCVAFTALSIGFLFGKCPQLQDDVFNENHMMLMQKIAIANCGTPFFWLKISQKSRFFFVMFHM
jgi:hypothetical protein